MNNHYGIVSLYCVYSPLKSEAAFFQKSLLWGNKNFSDNFVGGEGGYSKCVESFIDEFSPNRWNIHLKIKPWPFCWIELLKNLCLRLIVKRFQRLRHAEFLLILPLVWGIDILFEELTPETGRWISKTPFPLCLCGGNFIQSPSTFLISLVVSRTLMSWF